MHDEPVFRSAIVDEVNRAAAVEETERLRARVAELEAIRDEMARSNAASWAQSEKDADRIAFLTAALESCIDSSTPVAFVIEWNDMEDVDREADEDCVVVQFDEIYGEQIKAPELAAYLKERGAN